MFKKLQGVASAFSGRPCDTYHNLMGWLQNFRNETGASDGAFFSISHKLTHTVPRQALVAVDKYIVLSAIC